MAISSAMYAAVTGLSALSTGMQTISNNIANVNTIGFKAGRTNYEDLISQNYYSGGRVNQRGTGVKVSSIQSMFTQGSFMSSAQDTDMAIAGEGFFAVRNTLTNQIMYTRAGAFTLSKDGYLEDPSGNILQGWQMSIPKPGQSAVKIGSPTDIKITVLNAPPVATSEVKLAINLNADDESAYPYDKYQLAAEYADSVAEPLAASARTAAELAYWDPATDINAARGTQVATAPPMNRYQIDWVGAGTPPTTAEYRQAFLDFFNNTWGTSVASHNALRIVDDGTIITDAQRDLGWMTESEFDAYVTVTESTMLEKAAAAGETAYTTMYKSVYDSTYAAVTSRLTDWVLEGSGFAAAWDATKIPPIDTDNYTHTESMTIYDSLGSEHVLTVYYQKNPHMENVWDYIITCDPIEDARKDANFSLLMSDSASFAGLIQKGKITFSADGDDRHGGTIKDIEAQNIDLDKSMMAVIDPASYYAGATALTRNATIGGYYTGSPSINTYNGIYESSDRTYDLTWGKEDPAGSGIWVAASGMTWTDSDGRSGFIPMKDVNDMGPYYFGSGLSITFDPSSRPMTYGAPGTDGLTVDAHSEQIAWTNLTPNDAGFFDFDVAFVQSASMALHPPYPTGLPTIIQNIAMDMGASNPNGISGWKVGEPSTTQYASKSSTVFSSQDGYPAGSLQRISIGEDGVVTGIYTNGRQQALYQIGLTRFLNPWGLSKEGDNLFSTTNYSGEGALNEPGYGGTGTILGNFLEQSNVDLSEEIVSMILTQRGFQANSKTITTTDTMLAEVIEMKR